MSEFLELFAQPYNIDATGFTFSTFEEYEELRQDTTDLFGFPVEEFEIQYIDGRPFEAVLASLMRLHQGNLQEFFELIEELEHEPEITEKIIALDKLFVTLTADEIRQAVDEMILFEGTLREYAEEYIASTGVLDAIGFLDRYIDYPAFGRDLVLNGEVFEFLTLSGWWVLTNANGVL